MDAEALWLKSLILECGRPVKDDGWGDDWRDYEWDHAGNGCPGWQATEQSEMVEAPFEGATLFMLTHCRCACRVHPHITIGLEGTRGN